MQAILILAHKNIKQLIELVSVLNKRFVIYIHLDKKCELLTNEKLSLKKMKNVFLYRLFDVKWGSFNSCRAELFLLKEALKNEEITYCHFISGQDWPIKNLDLIYKFYNNNNKVYMIYDLADNVKKTGESIILWQKYYFNYDKINRKSLYGKIYHRLSMLYQFIKCTNKFKDLNINFKIYQGSQWISIPRDIAIYCLKYMKENKNYYNMLKTGFCSDEVMFQTIICNSIYKNRIENNNYRYIKWEKKHDSYPAILDEEEYSIVINSRCHFARKIDLKFSKKLIEKLNEENLKIKY